MSYLQSEYGTKSAIMSENVGHLNLKMLVFSGFSNSSY